MLSVIRVRICRSYKNGYVWNDLSENDVILPADGAEYVLKGSEIVDSCSGEWGTGNCPIEVEPIFSIIDREICLAWHRF